MKKFYKTLALLLLALMLIPTFGIAQYKVTTGERPPIDLSKISEDSYEKGVIHIKLTPEAAELLGEELLVAEKNLPLKTAVNSLNKLNERYNATVYRPSLYNLYQISAKSVAKKDKHRAWGFHLWYVVTLDEKSDIKKAVADFMTLPEVVSAEPVYKKVLIGNVEPREINQKPKTRTSVKSESKWTPNDARYAEQWHYNNTGQTGGTSDKDIDLPEAWNIEKGNSNVIVAVMDEGVDFDHPDIAGNMWATIGPEGTSTVAGDHGTHTAGTIAAVTNNTTGVSGIAGGTGSGDGVQIMSLDLFNGPLDTHEMNVYAADNGAAISQNSWGYGAAETYNDTDLTGIDYFNANGGGTVLSGGLTVFAAGNDDDNGNWYPGCYSGSLSVSATNHKDIKSWYSNYGTWVDISAPGGETDSNTDEGVLSTVSVSGGSYDFYQGTSMACPHVSGVAALVASYASVNGLTLSRTELWDIFSYNCG